MTSRSWLINYVALAVIWGLSFALIKQGLTSLTPLQVTTARLGLGAIVVVGLLLATRTFPRASRTESLLQNIGARQAEATGATDNLAVKMR